MTARSSAEDGRIRSGSRSLALAVVGTLAVAATLLALKPVHATVAPKTLEDGPVTRPNIVFITTDDMRMSDMAYMPNVKRLLASNGVTFSHALSPHPLCCPARAEWMTGQYGQNNGVHHNQGAHGGFPALIAPNNNLGAWLQAGGYRTAMTGKFMNGYRPADGKLAGWTHWNPTVKRVYAYADTTFFDDGAARVAAANTDDAIVDYTTRYIREFSRSDKPFMVWASQLAPHSAFVSHRWVPPIPAVRHRKLFSRAVNPSTRKPSYLVPPPGQHTSLLRSGDLSHLHVRRIEALQAVDEGVAKIVDTLRDTGELANTYIIFTSDNGYLLGEHNLHGKNYLYDEALRVPLVVRLPGSHPATQSSTPVTLVDIAPTISDLAGVTPGRLADGTSFEQTLLAGHQPWRSSQLVQTGRASHVASDPGWLLRGVRTGTWSYWRDQRSGKVKLFNRSTDPFQLRNVAGSQHMHLRKLQRQLRVLQSCAGSACSIGVR